jgi:hypothetical protein
MKRYAIAPTRLIPVSVSGLHYPSPFKFKQL